MCACVRARVLCYGKLQTDACGMESSAGMGSRVGTWKWGDRMSSSPTDHHHIPGNLHSIAECFVSHVAFLRQKTPSGLVFEAADRILRQTVNIYSHPDWVQVFHSQNEAKSFFVPCQKSSTAPFQTVRLILWRFATVFLFICLCVFAWHAGFPSSCVPSCVRVAMETNPQGETKGLNYLYRLFPLRGRTGPLQSDSSWGRTPLLFASVWYQALWDFSFFSLSLLRLKVHYFITRRVRTAKLSTLNVWRSARHRTKYATMTKVRRQARTCLSFRLRPPRLLCRPNKQRQP